MSCSATWASPSSPIRARRWRRCCACCGRWAAWPSPPGASRHDAAHAVLPSRPAAANARPFRYGEPGVLSRLLSEAEYQDVTPDRVTAALEYDTQDGYWQAVARGLAYADSPLAGLSAEQL